MTQKEKQSKENNGQSQYLTFEVGEEVYGLFLKDAKEIIKPPKVTNVPNTDNHVIGVINLRGKVVPVIDLKNKINLDGETELSDDKKIIILNLKGMVLGILIDSVREVITINENDIEDMEDTRNNLKKEYLKGVLNYKKDLIVIIDIKAILLDNQINPKKEDD